MTWMITALQRSRETRKRVGKSYTDTIESIHRDPAVVEAAYETAWDIGHPGSFTFIEVIDVRPAEENRHGS